MNPFGGEGAPAPSPLHHGQVKPLSLFACAFYRIGRLQVGSLVARPSAHWKGPRGGSRCLGVQVRGMPRSRHGLDQIRTAHDVDELETIRKGAGLVSLGVGPQRPDRFLIPGIPKIPWEFAMPLSQGLSRK